MFQGIRRQIRSSYHPVNTTGWGNQCALATLAHWYHEQITTNPKAFAKTHAYKQLALGLKKAYRIQNPPGIKHVQDLLNAYAHPHDKQIVLSLGLRRVLSKSLSEHKKYKAGLYKKFLAAAELIYYGKVKDPADFAEVYREVISPNLSCFLKIKQASIAAKGHPATFKRITGKLIKPYWDKIGYNRYCQHMGGQLKTQADGFAMVNAEELSILCDSLKIHLQIYNPKGDSEEFDYSKPMQSEQGYTGKNSAGTVHAAIGGSHWQRVLLNDEGKAQALAEKACEQKMAPVFSGEPVAQVKKQVLGTWIFKKQKELDALKLNIKQRKFHLIPNRFKTIPYLHKKMLKAFEIDKAIKHHDTEKLVAFACANQAASNWLVGHMLSEHPVYLARILSYKKHYLEVKQIRPSITLKGMIPDFDRIESHAGLETTKKLNQNWYGFNTGYKHCNLKPGKVAKLTALHSAIIRNDAALFETIQKAINYKTHGPGTDYTRIFGHKTLDIPDSNGMMPVHYLARHHKTEWLDKLHQCNPSSRPGFQQPLDIAHQDNSGHNALHHAVLSGNKASVNAILQYAEKHCKHGIKYELAAKNIDDLSPIELAFELEEMAIFGKLLKHKAYKPEDLTHLEGAILKLIQTDRKHWKLDTLVSALSKTALDKIDGVHLVHEAIRVGNYRALHILLHPLKASDKTKALKLKNAQGLTPTKLCKQLHDSLDKLETKSPQDEALIATFKKIGRLIAQHDKSAQSWVRSISDGVRFNYDMSCEFANTSSFRAGQAIKRYGPIAYNIVCANPKSMAQVVDIALPGYFGHDRVSNIITGMQLVNDIIPSGKFGYFTKFAYEAHQAWSNTAKRVSRFAANQMVAATRHLPDAPFIDGALWVTGANLSYMRYCELMGAVTSAGEYFAEEAVVESLVPKDYQSVETYLKEHHDISTPSEWIDWGLTLANGAIEAKTGVDVIKSAIRGYIGLRHKLGGEGDAMDKHLNFMLLSESEKIDHYYGNAELYAQLMGGHSMEDIIKAAMDEAMGSGDIQGEISKILAVWVVGYERNFFEYTDEQYQERLTYYEQNFNATQTGISLEASQSAYAANLSQGLSSQIQSVNYQFISSLMNVSDGGLPDISFIASSVVKTLNIPDENKVQLQTGFEMWMNSATQTPAHIGTAATQWLNIFMMPGLSTHATIDFCKLYGDALKSDEHNVGEMAGLMLSNALLNAGIITADNWQSTYEYLSHEYNTHYHNNKQGNGKDFESSMQSLLRAYYPEAKPHLGIESTAEGKIFVTTRDTYPENLAGSYCDAILEAFPELAEVDGYELSLRHAVANAPSHKHMMEAAHSVNLLYQTDTHMWHFLAAEPIYAGAYGLNQGYNPRDVRAAFGVMWADDQLAKTEGYNSLTPMEKVDLYNELKDKTDSDAFEHALFENIVAHCHTPGSMPTMHNGNDPSEFAAQVSESSIRYAQNEWQGATHWHTRDLTANDKKKGLRHDFMMSLNNITREGIQFGFGVDGAEINLFNLYGFKIPYSPEQKPLAYNPITTTPKPVATKPKAATASTPSDAAEVADLADAPQDESLHPVWQAENHLDHLKVMVPVEPEDPDRFKKEFEKIFGKSEPLPGDQPLLPIGGGTTLNQLIRRESNEEYDRYISSLYKLPGVEEVEIEKALANMAATSEGLQAMNMAGGLAGVAASQGGRAGIVSTRALPTMGRFAAAARFAPCLAGPFGLFIALLTIDYNTLRDLFRKDKTEFPLKPISADDIGYKGKNPNDAKPIGEIDGYEEYDGPKLDAIIRPEADVPNLGKLEFPPEEIKWVDGIYFRKDSAGSKSDGKLGDLDLNKIYDDALAGGTYSGQLVEFGKQSPKQLEKSIKSFDKLIYKHEMWLENPLLKAKDWEAFNNRRKNNTLHHWQEDIKRAKIYKYFAEVELEQRLRKKKHLEIS